MRLKNPCNFPSCKIFLYTFYAYPDLLRMMCIIIYKSQTWQVNPYIKPASYPLEEHDSLSDFLFCYTAHYCYSNSCSKFSILIIPGKAKCRSSMVAVGDLKLKL